MSILHKFHSITLTFKKIFAWCKPDRRNALIYLLVFAVIGGISLLDIHAFSPYVSVETESGTLGGSATTKNDGIASGGKYVQFGTTTSYTVSGNKLLGPDGQQYLPLGMTVYGISKIDWPTEINGTTGDLAQISASHDYWHANTVRIQVAPYYLIVDTNTDHTAYLNAVGQEVTAAENLGLNVIISAQYENTKSLYPLSAPNSSTEDFWKKLAVIYANDGRVWFDLYNEPYGDKPYSTWRNGDSSTGVIGMQTLVDEIRAVAPNNIIIAESIDDFQHFVGIKTNTNDYTLTGGNIVYAIHPYFYLPATVATAPQPVSWWQTKAWSATWGNFASQYPVLAGEWGAREGPATECQTNAYDLAPAFLTYISSLRIGLIGWALTPGAMIRGTSLTTPNAFDPGVPFDCINANTGATSQGAGVDTRQYFMSNGVYP